MSLLRIYAPLGEAPARCEWVLIDGRQFTRGEGTLAQLPRGAHRVQLVIPAAQVLIDVFGWFSTSAEGSGADNGARLIPVNPGRIVDTRDGTNLP